MSKEQIIRKILNENIEPGIKYHSPLPEDILPWYAYTRNKGHRILCVLKNCLSGDMTENDYRDRLVSAPVKTVLRGYTVHKGFIVVDCEYDADTGFITEPLDKESDTVFVSSRYVLSVGELYFPGTMRWPETVEYHYFSNNHELRFFLKSPSGYITEVIRKMPVHLGLFTRDDIILIVYKFTDHKKHLIPVHGYSPFSIHLVPNNIRTLPEIGSGNKQEGLLHIHLIDAGTGILEAARTVTLSTEFSQAFCSAIIEQSNKPLTDDYYERLRMIDARYPDNEILMKYCKIKCTG